MNIVIQISLADLGIVFKVVAICTVVAEQSKLPSELLPKSSYSIILNSSFIDIIKININIVIVIIGNLR